MTRDEYERMRFEASMDFARVWRNADLTHDHVRADLRVQEGVEGKPLRDIIAGLAVKDADALLAALGIERPREWKEVAAGLEDGTLKAVDTQKPEPPSVPLRCFLCGAPMEHKPYPGGWACPACDARPAPKPRVDYRVHPEADGTYTVWRYADGWKDRIIADRLPHTDAHHIARLLNEDEARNAAAGGTKGD